jgi:hypothetical protein
LTSVGNLASVLQEQGKYEVAEEMNRQVLAGYEKVLSVEHPFALTSVKQSGLVASRPRQIQGGRGDESTGADKGREGVGCGASSRAVVNIPKKNQPYLHHHIVFSLYSLPNMISVKSDLA